MKQTTLKRKALPVLSATEIDALCDQLCGEGSKNLAQKAEQLLGYKTLKSDIASRTEKAGQERAKRQCNAALLSALRELDIVPLETEAVEDFKRHKVKWSNLLVTVCLIGVVAGFCLTVLCLVAGAINGLVEGQRPLLTTYLSWIGFSGAAICLTTFCLVGSEYLGLYEWARKPIDQYANEIPEFALETAIRIKERLPSVVCHVDYLVAKKDPFLVVQLDTSDCFYLEQWNEPDFRAERQV